MVWCYTETCRESYKVCYIVLHFCVRVGGSTCDYSVGILEFSFFWHVTQRRLVFSFTDVSRHPFGPIVKGQAVKESSWTRRLKLGPIGCLETSVSNNLSTLCNIPEERISHLHCGGSLKSRSVDILPVSEAVSIIYIQADMHVIAPANNCELVMGLFQEVSRWMHPSALIKHNNLTTNSLNTRSYKTKDYRLNV
jgi:hypothetical protein